MERWSLGGGAGTKTPAPPAQRSCPGKDALPKPHFGNEGRHDFEDKVDDPSAATLVDLGSVREYLTTCPSAELHKPLRRIVALRESAQ